MQRVISITSRANSLKDLRGNLASGVLAEDHAYTTLNQKGIKVGGSAQTTASLGVTFRPFKGFRIGADWVVNARNYSDYQVSSSNYTANSDISVAEPWKIPWGNQVDLNRLLIQIRRRSCYSFW